MQLILPYFRSLFIWLPRLIEKLLNAGDMVFRLTNQIQARFDDFERSGLLERFPPVLAFQSVADATVSTSALVRGLFDRLPAGEHEITWTGRDDAGRRLSAGVYLSRVPTDRGGGASGKVVLIR